jgi:hypothetical protein
MWRRKWFIGLFIQFLVFQCAGIAFGEKDAAYTPTEERTVFSPFEKVEDWSVTIGASTDFYSAYVWRGQVLVDDPVFQPGAYVGIEKFTVSVWGNYSFDNDEWTELDYTLDYTTGLDVLSSNLEKADLSVGYIYYDFPNLPAGDDSQELYAKVGVDTFLSPSAAVYWDFDQGDGEYFEVAVEQNIPIRKASLNLCASVGYNDGQWDYASSWSAALFGASLSVPIGDRIVVEPGVFYSLALDNQYDDEFYGGVSLSVLVWNK